MDPNFIIIIELFGVQIRSQGSQEKITSKGWTLFAPFTINGYVRHGCFILPLFTGCPNRKAIKFWQRVDPHKALDDALDANAVKISYDYPSITIRIADGRRSDELESESLVASDIYLGSYNSKKFSPSIFALSNVHSLSIGKNEFNQQVYDVFTEHTLLPYIP